MIAMSVRIDNLDQLRSNFAKAPKRSLDLLSRATQAAVFEVEREAVDKNFQFSTPRSKRTGYLSLSFAYGRQFSNGGLRGAIGPTAHYAPYVYFGTSRGVRPNPYMERIADAASPAASKHFEKAIDTLVSEIAAT